LRPALIRGAILNNERFVRDVGLDMARRLQHHVRSADRTIT
jgi:hypothetical protein